MLNIILLIIVGSMLGRNKVVMKFFSDKVINNIFAILSFSFLLLTGYSIGSNPDVMDNLATMGLTSLLLAIGAILGSSIVSKFINKLKS
ncbi:hypothetical protein ACFL3T_00470 [Patescibacteria group bacterium]